MSSFHEVILLIMNCEKYKYKALKQKSTWLSQVDPNIPHFHVIGNPELTTEYLFDKNDKILYVKTPDDYVSLPKKVIKAYEAVNNEYTFNYIFKTDDDQELLDDGFFSKLMKTLSTNAYNYGGRLLYVNNHYSKYYMIHSELPHNLLLKKTSYCSGRFYFLSKAAVINVLGKSEIIKQHVIEDHAIGYYLDDDLKMHILNFVTDHFFRDIKF